MYRAQRLAEYGLYDGDPTLFDSELDQYLAVTSEQIRNAVKRHLDVDHRVVLDIVPAALAVEAGQAPAPSASPQQPGEPKQPSAPPPQVPSRPPAQPASESGAPLGGAVSGRLEPPQQPSDPPNKLNLTQGHSSLNE
jgi:uncharacterized membrane protein